MKAMWLGLAMGLAAAGSLVANAGTDISGGLDLYSPTPAWFLGDVPVRTCLQVAPDFGVDRLTLAATFQDSARAWKGYAVKKRVLDPRRPGYERPLLPSFDYSILESCDGTEELTLLFGITTPEVEAVLKSYTRPLALTRLESYDPSAGRGKGFIWFAPIEPGMARTAYADWAHEPFRLGAMTHELGHVLGNEHMAGTIMDARMGSLARMMKGDPGSADRVKALDMMFTSIDWNREIVFCEECAVEEVARPFTASSWIIPFGFEALTGRAPVGEARVGLQLNEGKTPGISALPPRAGKLILSDELETVEFPFELRNFGHGNFLDSEAFRTAKQDGSVPYLTVVHKRSIPRWGETHYTEVTARDGQKLIGILSRNVEQFTPLMFSLLLQRPSGLQEIPLFSANRPFVMLGDDGVITAPREAGKR